MQDNRKNHTKCLHLQTFRLKPTFMSYLQSSLWLLSSLEFPKFTVNRLVLSKILFFYPGRQRRIAQMPSRSRL